MTKTRNIALTPRPKTQTQRDGTCGYYAMSTVTDYWHVKCGALFWPARKQDLTPKAPVSLRQFGKSHVFIKQEDGTEAPSIGGIYNIYDFKPIMQKAGYETSIFEFNEYTHFKTIIAKALEHGFPIILPVDRDIKSVNGRRAHYITIISMTDLHSSSVCKYSSDGYHSANTKDLFDSCNNLQEYPCTLFVKNNHSWDKHTDKTPLAPNAKKFAQPAISLDNLRGKLALCYPPDWQDKFLTLSEDIKKSLFVEQRKVARKRKKKNQPIMDKDKNEDKVAEPKDKKPKISKNGLFRPSTSQSTNQLQSQPTQSTIPSPNMIRN